MFLLCLTGCANIQTGDTDLDNPFEKEYKIKIADVKGSNGHYEIQKFEEALKISGKDNKKTIKLSYSVKNKLSQMKSTYGAIVLPFEIFTVGTLDLLGMPSDFISQTIYMNADIVNEKGRTIGSYSSSGSAWHTVAMYYGYRTKDAMTMADVRAFNKALNNLYEKIENNSETLNTSVGLILNNTDLDKIVNSLVSDIIDSGALNKSSGKYVLAISDIDLDTKHPVDKEVFIKKLRIALQKEKKVTISTMKEDSLIMKSRELRKSKETNQENVASKNSLVAPEISLTGSIIEKDISDSKVEYTIMLTINDLKKGTSLWEGEKTIQKEE